MRTLLSLLLAFLCVSALGQTTNRTPINRGQLQTDADGNHKSWTNLNQVVATNYIDATTGLPLNNSGGPFNGSPNQFGTDPGNHIVVKDGSLQTNNTFYGTVSANGALVIVTNAAAGGSSAQLIISGNTANGGFSDLLTSDPSAFSLALGGSGRIFRVPSIASTGVIYGDGSGVTNLPASSITGNVTNFAGNGSGLTNVIALTNNPTINGDYQSVFSPSSDSTLPNKIGIDGGANIRNSGAAFSGIYSRMYGGSGSALSDLPSRGFDRWGGMTKPFFIISTRNAGSTGPGATTITTVTNGARVFATNGYVQAWTNFGVQVAFLLESPGWVTNYRSFEGYLCWNTNRFPLGWVSAGLFGHPYIATNVTTYLRTNGYEPWVMIYGTSLVPATNHWNGVALTYANNSGNTEWDGFGANPFGAGVEYAVTCNPESIHRDISSLYANDIAGIIFQDVNQSQSGYFDQMVRMMQGAILNPYYINQDWSGHQNVDGSWLNYSTVFAQNGRNAKHAMASGMFMAATGGPNPPKYAIDLNAIFNESNDAMAGPSGSGNTGVGWTMNQAKWKSIFLTNAFGFCHPTFAGDGNLYNSWGYNDWMGHFAAVAFFNANPFFMSDSGAANQWGYATGVNFSNLVKTVGYNWIKVNQDVSLNPSVCLSLNTNNSIWFRQLSDGSKLVLMENSRTDNPTNLTVNWSQLGIASNTIANPVDIMTNGYFGIYTNSITWSVPVSSAFLFRIPPQILTDSGTNNGQMFWDSVNNSGWINGQNNMRMVRFYGPSGSVMVGTNVGLFGNANVALSAAASSGGISLALYDSAGNEYDMVRSGVTGNLRIIGPQGDANTGVSIESTSGNGEIIRINGMGFYYCTNTVSSWPTAPLTRGGFGLVNSNSYVYLLQSDPAGIAWTSTNLLGKGEAGVSTGWSLTGNSGLAASSFLGTTDFYPLELRTANRRFLFADMMDAANVMTGGTASQPNAIYTNSTCEGNFIGGGFNNSISNSTAISVILGGDDNHMGTSVRGGIYNSLSSFIPNNSDICTIIGADSSLAGGVGAQKCIILGGLNNTNSGSWSAVIAGQFNKADHNYDLAAGRRSKATHDGVFIWGDSTDADYNDVGQDTFNVRAKSHFMSNSAAASSYFAFTNGTFALGSAVTQGALTTITTNHIQGKSYALLAQNTTAFWAPQGNAVTNIQTSDVDMQSRQAIGTGFKVVGVYFKASQAAGAGQTYTLTVMTNGVATALAPQIAGASATTASQFTSIPITEAAGDSIGIRIVSSATATTNTRFDWDVLYINQ
jgi:hypothetical protein